MLTPNRSKKIFQESDVTSPVGIIGTNDAYDLALFEDATGASKGVLVVKLDIQLIFKTGKDSKGKKLEWDHASRQQFVADYSSAIASVWNEKWRITSATEQTIFMTKDIGVMFEINLITSGWNVTEHWEVDVYKAEGWQQNYVSQFTGGSRQHSSSVEQTPKYLKPGCAGPANVCAITQRPSAHEFGHMLGLRDEYPSAKDNGNWEGDADSIMHSGEVVRPRHYAIFADWITSQCATLASVSKQKIEFKVDGSWDMAKAKL